jgi:hypothetical protein
MRLRILATPPLPELRAWFSVESSSTIAELKRDLCGRVNALRDAGLRGCDICLVLDEFELLDESSHTVLRDGDLIHVKKAVSVKRKVSGQGMSEILLLRTGLKCQQVALHVNGGELALQLKVFLLQPNL